MLLNISEFKKGIVFGYAIVLVVLTIVLAFLKMFGEAIASLFVSFYMFYSFRKKQQEVIPNEQVG